MGAALLGFALIMVYGTAFGLMFSCVNVIFRDFQRIVQTFINVIPFTAPMMYPYHLIADGERIPLQYHDLYVSNPVAVAVMLIQRGFWYPTCAPSCAVDPATGAALPEFVDDLYSRGFVMLGIGLVLLAAGQFVFSRLEKTVPERL
jgi:ABC-2 type transport system permease protein